MRSPPHKLPQTLAVDGHRLRPLPATGVSRSRAQTVTIAKRQAQPIPKRQRQTVPPHPCDPGCYGVMSSSQIA